MGWNDLASTQDKSTLDLMAEYRAAVRARDTERRAALEAQVKERVLHHIHPHGLEGVVWRLVSEVEALHGSGLRTYNDVQLLQETTLRLISDAAREVLKP